MEKVVHGIQGIQVNAVILQVRTPVERDSSLEAEVEQDSELHISRSENFVTSLKMIHCVYK